METKKYIFSLDYGNRMEEKEFIKAVLREFDRTRSWGVAFL